MQELAGRQIRATKNSWGVCHDDGSGGYGGNLGGYSGRCEMEADSISEDKMTARLDMTATGYDW